MKLSLDWISDFIPLSKVSRADLLDKINTSICEIDDLEDLSPFLETVVAVQVQSIEKHPNAEKLTIVQSFDGKTTHTVVTGANNIKVGDTIPLALPGTALPSKTIQISELRGISSYGMFCSGSEMGISDDSSGILILPKDTSLGQSLRTLFFLNDSILHIDNKSITHRPDLWSHFGFARELASQLSLPIHWNPLEQKAILQNEIDGIQVESTQFAHCYYATSIRNVTITDSLPKIKARLQKCGIKSINNVVDVSNYLLLEIGQPSHFFDRNKLSSTQFSVTKSKPGESLLLLDGNQVSLPEDSLVIRAGGQIEILAGLMGGKISSVQNETTDLVLESAIFPREEVRRSIRKTGIRTESAMRYEKGLDTFTALPLVHRAIQLLKENNAGVFTAYSPFGYDHQKDKKVVIHITQDFIAKKLGKVLSIEEITKILTNLSFSVESQGSLLKVNVPRFRHNYDITIPEDIVEEIGRTIGYGSISTEKLSFAIQTPIPNALRKLERNLKNLLSSFASFQETLNYSFASEDEQGFFQASGSYVRIANAMPKESAVLRTSLYPSLLRNLQVNQDRFSIVKIFEIGRTYFKKEESNLLAEEGRFLSFAYLSKAKNSDTSTLEEEFLSLREEIASILNSLAIIANFEKREPALGFHPNAFLKIQGADISLGELGILHSRLQDHYGLKRRAILGSIDLLALLSILENKNKVNGFKTPSSFPQGELDITLLIPEEDSTYPYWKAVQQANIPELETGYVSSIFRNESLGLGKKSVSYRFQLMSYDKTFTQERFKEISDLLVSIAKEKGFSLR